MTIEDGPSANGFTKKLSLAEFSAWDASYYKRKLSGTLRYGQAFLNENFPHVSYPTLFYIKDPIIAIDLIFKHFIEVPNHGEQA